MLNIILGICGFSLLILAGIVVYSDRRSSSNRWLGVFLGSTFIWLVANLLTNVASSQTLALTFARAALVGSSLVALSFLMFCYHFTGRGAHLTPLNRSLIYAPVFLLLLSTPTKLNVKSVSMHGASFEPGIAYGALLVLAVLYFGAGAVLLVKEYRHTNAIKRQQLYYILMGSVLTVVPVGIVSAVLPIFGYSGAAPVSPALAMIFAAFTSYAIVKHQLFDVRLLIARSLTYTTSLLILALLYGAVVFTIARLLFDLRFSLPVQIFLSLATGLAGLTFQRLQQVFDKLSSRLFYQDSYDTQGFLDQFNKILVSTFDIDPLLKKSADMIEANLKTSFAAFIIYETAMTNSRVIGTSSQWQFAAADIARIKKAVPLTTSKIKVTLDLDDKHQALKTELRQKNIEVLARLATHGREEGVGYLVLGPKKSGNPYSVQDLKVIEIITNELVIAIHNALRTEEIKNFNLTLQARIEDATRKLRRTNQKLKELDEAKDDFVSMASHQLRTPLTSIKGYTSMVLEGDAGKINATQRKLLEQSFFSSQRMVYLIADLLNVSRLKTGKFIIEPIPVNLAEVVQQEIGQLKETAAGRSLELEYDMPESFPELMLDETKTRQVIMNFIDNAIYYTPAGGHIEVKLIETPASVELRVSDDGIGVPKSEQPHLFTKFYRAGNARKARPDGTGLGLFMARKVVVAEGGAVLFETEEGKGSTFGFVFSKSKLAPKTVTKP